MPRRFGIAIVDEAHKLKDRNTKRWMEFALLKADFVFVMGATPMSNVGSDAIAQIELIWVCTERIIEITATDDEKEWISQRKGLMSMYYDGEKLVDPRDIRRLGFIHPNTFLTCLGTGQLQIKPGIVCSLPTSYA